MRTIYRAGILTAALMVLVLGGCSSFDRGGEEMASVAGRGADARLGLDAGQGPNAVLKEGGLEERMDNFPAQLSGGEQQRVSIARALAKNPKLLLCDEPTGALDYNTGKAILKLLQEMCREKGMTVIVITHNSALAPMADRLIKIKNGKVSSMKVNENPISIDEIEW